MVKVVSYNPAWKTEFDKAKKFYTSLFHDLNCKIVHVGSTSVEGMWAKPILDIDIIVTDNNTCEKTIACLENVGYEHLGDLGIPLREAFKNPRDNPEIDWMDHNLYVCIDGSESLTNHLLLKKHLLEDPDSREEYNNLKRALVEKHSTDIDTYIEGKSALISRFLRAEGMGDHELENIQKLNKKKS